MRHGADPNRMGIWGQFPNLLLLYVLVYATLFYFFGGTNPNSDKPVTEI